MPFSTNLRLLGQDPLRLSLIGDFPAGLADAIGGLLSSPEDGGIGAGWRVDVFSHLTVLEAERLVQEKAALRERPHLVLLALGREDAKRRQGDAVLRTPASVFNERLGAVIQQMRTVLNATVLWLLLPESGPLFDDHEALSLSSSSSSSATAAEGASSEAWFPPRPIDISLFSEIAKHVCWRSGVETVDLSSLLLSSPLLALPDAMALEDLSHRRSSSPSPSSSSGRGEQERSRSPSGGVFSFPSFSSFSPSARRGLSAYNNNRQHSQSFSHGMDKQGGGGGEGGGGAKLDPQRRSLSFSSRLDWVADAATDQDDNNDEGDKDGEDASARNNLVMVKFKQQEEEGEKEGKGGSLTATTPGESAAPRSSFAAVSTGGAPATPSSGRYEQGGEHPRRQWRSQSSQLPAHHHHWPPPHDEEEEEEERRRLRKQLLRQYRERVFSAFASFIAGRVSALETEIRGLMPESDGSRWPWLIPLSLFPRFLLDKLPLALKRHQGSLVLLAGVGLGFYLGFRYSENRMTLTTRLSQQTVMAAAASVAATASAAAAAATKAMAGAAAAGVKATGPNAASCSFPRFGSSFNSMVAVPPSVDGTGALSFLSPETRAALLATVEAAARRTADSAAAAGAAAATTVSDKR